MTDFDRGVQAERDRVMALLRAASEQPGVDVSKLREWVRYPSNDETTTLKRTRR